MASMLITLPDETKICCGKQVTFRAPCTCASVDTLVIRGISYALTDSINRPVSSTFAENSLISVIIDPESNKAYLLNQVRVSYDQFTLLLDEWSADKTYQLEDDYPHEYCDIEISIDKSATLEQIEAFNSAIICGSCDSNIITAKGKLPTIDIPIIVKVVNK